jgi:hypothetical protein
MDMSWIFGFNFDYPRIEKFMIGYMNFSNTISFLFSCLDLLLLAHAFCHVYVLTKSLTSLLLQDGRSIVHADRWMSFVDPFDASQMSWFNPRLITSL